MNRIDVKNKVIDEVEFRLNKTRTLFRFEKLLAEKGINKIMPFFIFIDEEDPASCTYVKYKIMDLEKSKIKAIPISFSDVYTEGFESVEKIISNFYSKLKTKDIPFIIQIPSSKERFELFNKHKVKEFIETYVINNASEDIRMYLDADYFYNEHNKSVIENDIKRLEGSSASDSATMNYLISNSRLPATPKGILAIISEMIPKLKFKRSGNRNFTGLKVALVGCNSKTTGIYLKDILPRLKATVSLYHSKSEIQENEFIDYDIVISCVGNKGFIDKKIIGESKFDRLFIDVGVTVDENRKVVGDFHIDIRTKGNHYTPYVNGVGLLTRSALLSNIELSYRGIITKEDKNDIR
ncbi:MAG: hypothetical protein ACRCX8_04965 [Sarcina sp.]